MSRLLSTPAARVLLVVLLAAAVVLIFRASYANMVGLWALSSYQHAYIVPPMSLLLLWLARREFAALPLVGSGVGVALLAVLAVLWLGARATAVQAAEHIAIVAMVIALVLAVVGRSAWRTIAFPLLFLLAAVPVGEELTPLLMNATADVSEVLLGLLGVPVLREGMFFTLPGGSFEVAEICAGLRYLMAGTVTALLFAYLNFNRWGKRIAFTLLAAASFVLANGLRAFITMLVASTTNGRVLGGRDHIYFGMVLFAALLVVLLWFGMKLADPAPTKTELAPVDPALNRPARVAGFGIVALLLLSAAANLQSSHDDSVATLVAARLPALDGCSGPSEWSAPWRPEFTGADVETLASYRCGVFKLHVYLASYGHQEQSKELISAQNHLVPFEWRRTTRQRAITVEVVPGASFELNETRVTATGRYVLAWHWYDVNGTPSHMRLRTKLDEALAALKPAAVVSTVRMVAVSSEVGDFEAMRLLLETQMRTLWPLPALSAGRDGRP